MSDRLPGFWYKVKLHLPLDLLKTAATSSNNANCMNVELMKNLYEWMQMLFIESEIKT
jgi:hypothetical protein